MGEADAKNVWTITHVGDAYIQYLSTFDNKEYILYVLSFDRVYDFSDRFEQFFFHVQSLHNISVQQFFEIIVHLL